MRVLLVRHAAGDHVGRVLAGRADGWSLNAEGRAQAERLAARLAVREPRVTALYASPLQRCAETAAPLARALGLEVRPATGFTEIDYGDWTGREYAAMADDPAWQRWNTFRTGARIPGGESMLEVQARAVHELLGWRAVHDDDTVAVISHGDPIRAVLCYFLGMPLDLLQRLEVDPASVSAVEVGDWGVKVVGVNG